MKVKGEKISGNKLPSKATSLKITNRSSLKFVMKQTNNIIKSQIETFALSILNNFGQEVQTLSNNSRVVSYLYRILLY